MQRANASFVVGTSSWKEQFVEALTVSAGEEYTWEYQADPHRTSEIREALVGAQNELD